MTQMDQTTGISEKNHSVAYSWFALYQHENYQEAVVLEIRQNPGEGFTLHTGIAGIEYHIAERRFFHLLETLFERLPHEASLMLNHDVLLQMSDTEQIVKVTEWIKAHRYGNNLSPAYQLELTLGDTRLLTQPLADARAALDWLVSQLEPGQHLKICAFCELMAEYDVYGDTDGRHDLLYCFRDNVDALDQIRATSKKSIHFPKMLFNLALQDIDAFHTCSSFTLVEDYQSRIENVKTRIALKGTP